MIQISCPFLRIAKGNIFRVFRDDLTLIYDFIFRTKKYLVNSDSVSFLTDMAPNKYFLGGGNVNLAKLGTDLTYWSGLMVSNLGLLVRYAPVMIF